MRKVLLDKMHIENARSSGLHCKSGLGLWAKVLDHVLERRAQGPREVHVPLVQVRRAWASMVVVLVVIFIDILLWFVLNVQPKAFIIWEHVVRRTMYKYTMLFVYHHGRILVMQRFDLYKNRFGSVLDQKPRFTIRFGFLKIDFLKANIPSIIDNMNTTCACKYYIAIINWVHVNWCCWFCICTWTWKLK